MFGKLLSRLLTKLLMLDGGYLRKKLLLQPVVHGPEARLQVGKRTDLNDTVFNTLGGRIEVGNFTFFGHGCQVLTGTHDSAARGLERKEHGDSGGDVIIGSGVWIASGAIIIGPCRIADHCVIAAGAVVAGDCVREGIYAGVPARWIKPLEGAARS